MSTPSTVLARLPRPFSLISSAIVAALFIPPNVAHTSPNAPLPAPIKITLIGLNDLHGGIEEKTVTLDNGAVKRPVKVGGAPIMASYFRAVRAENPRTLILDSGDTYQGTLLSNYFEGEPVLKAYNELGIDASTFGNHEFDYGDLNDHPGGPTQGDPQGAMKKLLRMAKFPYLSSNVVSLTAPGQEGLIGFENVLPSKLFDLNGIKVGVIGGTTETTPREAAAPNLQGLAFKNLTYTVPAQAEILRKQGAQLVILIAHAGGICDMTRPAQEGDQACKSAQPDEITRLLDSIPEGTLDAVLAGHVHQAQGHLIRGVPVMQTYGFGGSFSRLDIWVNHAAKADDPRSRRIAKIEISKPTYFCHEHFENYSSCAAEEAKLGGKYPVDFGKSIPATYLGNEMVRDTALAELLSPYQTKIEALKKRKVIDLPAELAFDRFSESPASNCVADALKEQVEFETGQEFDVLATHSGGIRSKLPANVTFGDVFSVLPFDGSMAILNLTGDELERFGEYLSETPKSIAVLSGGGTGAGWMVKLAKNAVFPRHRGFITPSVQRPDPVLYYTVLTEDFNVLSGKTIDSMIAKAQAEGRVEILPRVTRDLLDARLTRGGKLPVSCVGGALDRTKFVE